METVWRIQILLLFSYIVHCGHVADHDGLCQDDGVIPNVCKEKYSKDGRLVADCSSANLTNLHMTLPRITPILDLHNNLIEMLPAFSFRGCNSLVHLDLSYNRLYILQQNVFATLHNLTTLYIDHNFLDFTSYVQVPSNIFHSLQMLKTLYIHKNRWQNTTEYRDNIFANLHGLKILAMDGVPVPSAVLGPGFQSLKHLEELYIQAGLTYVGNNTLFNLFNSPLKKLTIQSGVLLDLDALAFAHFNDLQELDLSYNPMLGLSNASNAWYGLQFTNIDILRLQYSVPFEKDIIQVDKSFYEYLNCTLLKELYLNGNNIITMYANLNESLPHLEVLSISHNRLSQINNIVRDFATLQQLKYLFANYQTRRQSITELALIYGYGRPDLQKEKLYMESKDIKTVSKQNFGTYCGNNIGPYSMRAVDPYDGLPEPLPEPEIQLDIQLPPNIEELHLSESLSVDWYTFPKTFMRGPAKVHFLDYSGNGMVIMKGPAIFTNDSARNLTIDMSKNQGTYLDPSLIQFENCTNAKLVAIHASENRLGIQLQSDRDGIIFSNYSELEYLDLRENQIYDLPKDIFQFLTKLETLDLSGNALREFTISPSTLERLFHLDLSGNLLSSLKQNTYNALDQQGSKITVVLADNPFVCSCDTLDFMKWVRQTEVNLPDYLQYECSYRGFLSKFQNLDEMIDKLNIECSMTTIILGVTIPVVVIVIIIALSFFCHRHKWEIRFWFMHSIIHKKPPVQNRTFENDAFVSFQERDLPFVKNELIPNLEHYASKEGEDNFKLVIHHRDFAIGYPIADNIFESIDNSRKTLVVLSNNFVESNWTYFELQMATMRTLDDGRDIIIVIVLESVPARKMTSALLQLLQHNTYIEWPSHEADKPLFWQRLREALRKDIPRPVRCQNCAKIVYQKKYNKKDIPND